MAQLSYWVTWIPEGQTEDEAINSHSAGYLWLDDDGVPTMGPQEPGPEAPAPSAEIDAFLRAAVERLRALEPSLEEDNDERKLEDGHLRSVELADDLDHWIQLSPGQAWIRPNWSDGSTFPRCWAYLQLLASLAPSVVQIETSVICDDDRVDTSLSAEDARFDFGWG